MPCIGNDIVDWKDPENAEKSRDSRYLEKILTNAEIDFVRNAVNPDLTLWSLWACKEAAYKTITKAAGSTPFLPRQWQVHWESSDLLSSPAGKVIFPQGQVIFIKLSGTETYLHCIGTDQEPCLNQIVWEADTIPKAATNSISDPSIFLHDILLHKLASLYQLDIDALQICRRRINQELQPPVLYYKNEKMPFDISLSHDGKFVAYAFLKQ